MKIKPINVLIGSFIVPGSLLIGAGHLVFSGAWKYGLLLTLPGLLIALICDLNDPHQAKYWKK